MANASYWEKRHKQFDIATDVFTERAIESVRSAYINSMKRVASDIETLYARYAKKQGVPINAAVEVLRGSEYRAWRFSIEQYLSMIDAEGAEEGKAALLRELDTLAYRSRITRLDELQSVIYRNMINLGDDYYKIFESAMTNEFNERRAEGLYLLAKDVGAFPATIQGRLSARRVIEAINTPWFGENFSSRAWKDTRALCDELQKIAGENVILGRGYNELADELARKSVFAMVSESYDKKFKKAKRLIKSEMGHVAAQADLHCYKEFGAKTYVYRITPKDACDVCRELEGQEFDVNKAEAGKNYPKMHANCYCYTVAGGSLIQGYRRIKQDDGTYIKIPRSMSYKDFKREVLADGSMARKEVIDVEKAEERKIELKS